jgi:hypothetical protein
VFNEYLQQLPPVIVAEPCAAPQPWGSSTNHSGTPTSPHLLAVAPLTEGPMTAAAAAAGSGAAWQQQQQQHAEGGRGAGSPQGYAAGQVSFAGYAKGAGEPQHAALERSGPGKGGAAGGRAGGQQQQQQQQQQPAGRQQRTLSGPGVDGARRLPDQDGQAGYADAHAAALMVSLASWSGGAPAAPPAAGQQQRLPAPAAASATVGGGSARRVVCCLPAGGLRARHALACVSVGAPPPAALMGLGAACSRTCAMPPLTAGAGARQAAR